MKIGILGGTFNPPHIGHLVLAQEVLEHLKLDKIFFIPTNNPPHKKGKQLEPKKRFLMAKLTVAGNYKFKVLDLELKRKGKSYTVDTIAELKTKYPKDKLYLIIGSDLAKDFKKWKSPEKIKKMATVVVAKRRGSPFRSSKSFKQVDIIQIELSSSQIRERIKKGKTVKYLVPKKVENYIKENNLYKQ
ncbi:MAG: nicotinate-nucleotide adenylyltransferase [Candidatus Omnitrophica bacterium]|nr:nicotinate-nucleotide adenylyltransferase [Candidatus Omnitrophota bacterium]